MMRPIATFAAGLVVGASILTALLAARGPRLPAAARAGEAPKQGTAAQSFHVEIDRPYDVHCTLVSQSPTAYLNCRILGFTARGLGGVNAAAPPTSSGFSSSSYDRGAPYFDDWLVLRLSDGRRAYIPANAVNYIEEPRPAP